MRGVVELTMFLQITPPKAITLASKSPRVELRSHHSLVQVVPGCLLGLQHPLLATIVLSGFAPTSQLTFEASILPEASVLPWLSQPSTGVSPPLVHIKT